MQVKTGKRWEQSRGERFIHTALNPTLQIAADVIPGFQARG